MKSSLLKQNISLDQFLDIGIRHLIGLAFIDNIIFQFLRHISRFLPYVMTVFPLSGECIGVHQIQIAVFTSHFHIIAILERIGTVFVRHNRHLTVSQPGNLRTGLFSVRPIDLNLTVILTTDHLFFSFKTVGIHYPHTYQFLIRHLLFCFSLNSISYGYNSKHKHYT